jgi:hypothetical protein
MMFAVNFHDLCWKAKVMLGKWLGLDGHDHTYCATDLDQAEDIDCILRSIVALRQLERQNALLTMRLLSSNSFCFVLSDILLFSLA